ncbi:MAG TPA: Gfo/Idh/MocA family oxidoreductase [Pseudonocardia sp.]|jgi:hypothetical protein
MAAPDLRIGIVGVESSHAEHLITHLNVERRFAARVTALADGPAERARELAATGGISQLVDSVPALLPLCDALIVTNRHGATHAERALPFLHAGRPVFVDKPFAASVADAETMVHAARASGAALTSSSALLWLPEFTELYTALPDLGQLQTIVATGPADPADEYGGLLFYGAHPVNVALGLAPDGPLRQLRVERTDGGVVASCRVGEVFVQVLLICPDEHGEVPFQLQAVGRHGAEHRQFSLDEDYLLPTLVAFLHMVESGRPPISAHRMVRDVEFLQAICASG